MAAMAAEQDEMGDVIGVEDGSTAVELLSAWIVDREQRQQRQGVGIERGRQLEGLAQCGVLTVVDAARKPPCSAPDSSSAGRTEDSSDKHQ